MREIENFKQIETIIKQDKLVCLYFSTNSCNVCKILKPKIADSLDSFIAEKIEMYYIDTDKFKEAAGQFMVFSVPIIMFYQNEKELKRYNRFVSIEEIKYFLNRYLDF